MHSRWHFKCGTEWKSWLRVNFNAVESVGINQHSQTHVNASRGLREVNVHKGARSKWKPLSIFPVEMMRTKPRAFSLSPSPLSLRSQRFHHRTWWGPNKESPLSLTARGWPWPLREYHLRATAVFPHCCMSSTANSHWRAH